MSFQELVAEQLSKTALADCFKYTVRGDSILVYDHDGLLLGSFYIADDDDGESWYFAVNTEIVLSDVDDRLLAQVWVILNEM